MGSVEEEPIALHVLVVGFHHKKGMQVEYVHPPFAEPAVGSECNLPEKWKHLPSLCLPDGAHNHEADTVYFHLPHLTNDSQTVFGVSCYRQIDAEKVTNRTADITRNTVQKSVCVLTTLPIYGYLQERLKVTTKVYFKAGDFSDVRDLEGLYQDLNCVNWKERLLHGVCASDVVKTFGRNILVLFKLILLERKVLFYNSSVAPLVRVITSLLALLPHNLPDGLAQSAAVSNYYEGLSEGDKLNGASSFSSLPSVHKNPETSFLPSQSSTEEIKATGDDACDSNVIPLRDIIETSPVTLSKDSSSDELSERQSSNSSLTSVTSRGSLTSPSSFFLPTEDLTAHNFTSKISSIKGRLSGAFNYWSGKEKITQEKPLFTATPHPSPSESGDETPASPSGAAPVVIEDQSALAHLNSILERYSNLETGECGLPLHIFTKGNLLHPYLSLQYLDVLTSPSTRAFLVGVSNTLFIHKRNLYDVLIRVDEGKIEISDPVLKKELSLTTEDLRFAENIVRQVESAYVNSSDHCQSSKLTYTDVFLEGVGWLGGEEWLRHQFKIYLLTLLRATLCPEESREPELFNGSFVAAWRQTHNYRIWSTSGPYSILLEMESLHPYSGNLSMADMRIKLAHTIQAFDKGRRLNQTLTNTGTAVQKTKEAMGGALTSAKGALSTLWTTFTAGSPRVEAEESPEMAIEQSLEEAQEVTEDLQTEQDKIISEITDGGTSEKDERELID